MGRFVRKPVNANKVNCGVSFIGLNSLGLLQLKTEGKQYVTENLTEKLQN